MKRNLVAKLLPDEGGNPLLRVVIHDKDSALDVADLRPCGHAELVGKSFQRSPSIFLHAFRTKTKCDQCEEQDDIWLCLTCLACCCSRAGGGHGLNHYSETGHCVILSLVTLNFWCYAHEEYLEHDFYPVLLPLYRKLHEIRHGEEPPFQEPPHQYDTPAPGLLQPQQQLPSAGGIGVGMDNTTTSNSDCTHVELGVSRVFPCAADLGCLSKMTCKECGNDKETWICLSCFECHCGRFANKHMIEHASKCAGHDICMNCKDMSIWCQQCQNYLDTFRHPLLAATFAFLYERKKDPESEFLPLPAPLNKRFRQISNGSQSLLSLSELPSLDWQDDLFVFNQDEEEEFGKFR